MGTVAVCFGVGIACAMREPGPAGRTVDLTACTLKYMQFHTVELPSELNIINLPRDSIHISGYALRYVGRRHVDIDYEANE